MDGLQIVPKSIYSQTAPVFAVAPLAQKVEHLPEGECQDKMIGVVADQEEKGGRPFIPQSIQSQLFIAHSLSNFAMSKESNLAPYEIRIDFPFCQRRFVKDFLHFRAKNKARNLFLDSWSTVLLCCLLCFQFFPFVKWKSCVFRNFFKCQNPICQYSLRGIDYSFFQCLILHIFHSTAHNLDSLLALFEKSRPVRQRGGCLIAAAPRFLISSHFCFFIQSIMKTIRYIISYPYLRVNIRTIFFSI